MVKLMEAKDNEQIINEAREKREGSILKCQQIIYTTTK